jgi:hypothetical protein
MFICVLTDTNLLLRYSSNCSQVINFVVGKAEDNGNITAIDISYFPCLLDKHVPTYSTKWKDVLTDVNHNEICVRSCAVFLFCTTGQKIKFSLSSCVLKSK